MSDGFINVAIGPYSNALWMYTNVISRPGTTIGRILFLYANLMNDFNDTFINTTDLKVKDDTKNVLSDRLSGLISYYKGGKADLMATVTKLKKTRK